MSRNSTAASVTAACSTGTSWFTTASSMTLPMPLRPKMASVMIDPASRSPTMIAEMVSVGRAALGSRCRDTTWNPLRPLAIATVAYCSARAVSSALIRTCAMGADAGMARVTAG